MKNIFLYILLFVISVSVFVCCNDNKPKIIKVKESVNIKRFENLIFSTPFDSLEQVLKSKEYDYRFLFNAPLSDTQYLSQLQAFAKDSIMKQVYEVVKTLYPDLSGLEKDLGVAMKKTKNLFPNIPNKEIYTLITGSFAYYDRVICTDSFLAISIDQYSIQKMKYFNGYFGMPMYMVNMLDSVHILPDCMSAVALSLIPQERKQQSLLDLMVLNGKILYFLDNVLPETPDSLKIRYTSQQLQWAQENESNVWSYFIQNQLLYETDYALIRKFVDEAPKTSSFKDSAPRMSDFVGWQIIKKYVDRNKVSMKELFAMTDSQKILTDSGYKPNRKIHQ